MKAPKSEKLISKSYSIVKELDKLTLNEALFVLRNAECILKDHIRVDITHFPN